MSDERAPLLEHDVAATVAALSARLKETADGPLINGTLASDWASALRDAAAAYRDIREALRP